MRNARTPRPPGEDAVPATSASTRQLFIRLEQGFSAVDLIGVGEDGPFHALEREHIVGRDQYVEKAAEAEYSPTIS